MRTHFEKEWRGTLHLVQFNNVISVIKSAVAIEKSVGDARKLANTGEELIVLSLKKLIIREKID